MKNFHNKSLKIQLNKSGNKILMTWVGQSDDRNPSATLNPYLNSLIDSLKGNELIIEYSKLEYMNSSTVPPIIQFIKKLNTSGIKTVIQYDAKSKWQCASFKALETLSVMMNCITVKPS